jgi:hypothetical protein
MEVAVYSESLYMYWTNCTASHLASTDQSQKQNFYFSLHSYTLLRFTGQFSVPLGQCWGAMRGHSIPEWCVVTTEHDVTFSATKLIVQSAIYRTGTLYLNVCLLVMDKFDPDSSRMRGQNLCEKEASHFPYPRFPIPQHD